MGEKIEKKNESLFINRELSWLAFNKRVLDLAQDAEVPLAEQLKFAAIYGSNLEEFFMVRVGSLYDRSLLKKDETENKTGMTAAQQLDAIMPEVRALQKSCDVTMKALYVGVKKQGLEKVDFTKLSKQEEQQWKKYFTYELLPVLSPQIVDNTRPFPFMGNGNMCVCAHLAEKGTKINFGLIPITKRFERVIFTQNGNVTQYALVEELIHHFIDEVFGKKAIVSSCIFRVIRNADITMDEAMFDHDIDYRDVMIELLKKRRKLAPVCMQVYGKTASHSDTIDFLCKRLPLPVNQVVYQSAPLDLSFCFKLTKKLESMGKKELFYVPRKPMLPPEGFDLAKQARQKDVLLYYPYQSMRPFINMLQKAAQDKEVVSIKMTLYRVATDSKVVQALIDAAENGKEVTVFVELRARFDEQNNIDWSKQLENAGCTVIYGLADYKVHSKLTLITKHSGGKYSYITQIGTGNYNEKTAEQYTDLSFVTTKTEVGEEAAAVFNNMAMERLTPHTDKLLVAPLCFKSVILQEIDLQIAAKKAGRDAAVVIKCNSVSDKELIEKISEASCAGVSVKMIIRGICCLRAGVKGLTENVEVHSIVGRYLEHSRIYAFGTGDERRVYICSGDFLTRNTQRRVEVGVQVEDADCKERLFNYLAMQLADTVNTQVMQPDGTYKKIHAKEGDAVLDSQLQAYSFCEKNWGSAAKAAEKPHAGLLGKLRKLFNK